MRIGIDARFYGPLGKGLGRYTQKLITYLEKVDQDNDYFIFLRRENWADYQPENRRFTKILADYHWYTLYEQIFMPLKIWSLKLDIMHFTHFNVPLLYFGRFVVTIHDLILTKYPTERASTLGPWLYKIKHIGYQMIISLAVRRAKRIITVSQCTKKEIAEHFHVSPDKIFITYEAVDPPQKKLDNEAMVLSKYSLRRPYLLYVGNVYPHKNIEGLLAAFKEVLVNKPNYYLVLVGKDDYFFRRIKKEVELLELDKNVIFTGFVTDEDLPYLYKNASLYVFPSFYEGFGLPALEACSYGVPVAASNSSSLPEVLDKAAFYFDPHDKDDIAKKILRVLDNKELADELVQNGFQRISFFSWQKMAQTTLDLYKSYT